MSFVIKENEVGEIMYFNPFDRLVISVRFLHLFDQRRIGFNNRMTVHADVGTGDCRMLWFVNRGMTIKARDFIVAGVSFMAKRDRLSWRVADVIPEIPNKGNDKSYSQKEKEPSNFYSFTLNQNWSSCLSLKRIHLYLALQFSNISYEKMLSKVCKILKIALFTLWFSFCPAKIAGLSQNFFTPVCRERKVSLHLKKIYIFFELT